MIRLQTKQTKPVITIYTEWEQSPALLLYDQTSTLDPSLFLQPHEPAPAATCDGVRA